MLRDLYPTLIIIIGEGDKFDFCEDDDSWEVLCSSRSNLSMELATQESGIITYTMIFLCHSVS